MVLKIIAEVTPGRVHGLQGYLPEVAELADAVDIPESPLGIPHPNSVATAAYLKARYGCEVIPHVRLVDLNKVSLLSLAYAAKAFGAYGLVILRGEGRAPTWVGSSEEAALIIKGTKGLRDLRLGAILSLRYPPDKIVKRAEGPFSFFLATRLDPRNPEEQEESLRHVRSLGKEVYPYVIVATKDNRDVISYVKQPFITEGELRDVVEGLEGLVDGVVVSVPHDREGLKRCLRILRRS